jgi:hypothetical protein
MSKVTDVISKSREDKKRRDAEWDEMQEQHKLEHRHREEIKQGGVMPHLRPATPKDYNRWLTGYIQNGGEPSHCYDYPMTRARFYIAIRDFVLHPFYGAQSINVIVPVGVNVSVYDAGHNSVFYMEEFKKGAFTTVPLYSDFQEVN